MILSLCLGYHVGRVTSHFLRGRFLAAEESKLSEGWVHLALVRPPFGVLWHIIYEIKGLDEYIANIVLLNTYSVTDSDHTLSKPKIFPKNT